MGRTGRAGNKGIAVGFVNQKNKGIAPELCTLLSEAKQTVPAFLTGMAYATGGYAGMVTVWDPRFFTFSALTQSCFLALAHVLPFVHTHRRRSEGRTSV